MDVKSAFINVSKAHLGRRMEALEVESDLIRWTGSFMSDRQVKLVLDGEVGEANPVDTGIPQGSSAAPILSATYLLGVFMRWEGQSQASKGYHLWTTLGGGQTERSAGQQIMDSFLLFGCDFLGAHRIILEQGGGQRGACNVPLSHPSSSGLTVQAKKVYGNTVT